jgi:hypothetical protein
VGPVLSLLIVRIKDKLLTTGRSSISLFNRTFSVDVTSIPPLNIFGNGGKKINLNRIDYRDRNRWSTLVSSKWTL